MFWADNNWQIATVLYWTTGTGIFQTDLQQFFYDRPCLQLYPTSSKNPIITYWLCPYPSAPTVAQGYFAPIKLSVCHCLSLQAFYEGPLYFQVCPLSSGRSHLAICHLLRACLCGLWAQRPLQWSAQLCAHTRRPWHISVLANVCVVLFMCIHDISDIRTMSISHGNSYSDHKAHMKLNWKNQQNFFCHITSREWQ